MTPKQKLFVKEYLVDLNATRAAIAAGYSEKTADVQGPRLLGNVGVRKEIERLVQKKSEKLEISIDYVLGGIKNVTDRSMQTGDEYDAFAALKGCELLGKYLKLFAEKPSDTSVTINFNNFVSRPNGNSDRDVSAISETKRIPQLPS